MCKMLLRGAALSQTLLKENKKKSSTVPNNVGSFNKMKSTILYSKPLKTYIIWSRRSTTEDFIV
jgi:hypothetical protein